MNVAELGEFLKQKGFEEVVVEKFKNEEVDEELFTKMSATHLHLLNLKLSTILKLEEIINTLKFQNEFERLFPEATDFRSKLEKASTKLFTKFKENKNSCYLDQLGENPTLDKKLDFIMLSLPYNITSPLKRTKRASVVEVLSKFVIIKPVGFAVTLVIEELNTKAITYPVIVVMGGFGHFHEFYLFIEGDMYPIQRGGLVSSVERIIKVFYVMNMAFPPNCEHIYQFLVVSFFELYTNKKILYRSVNELVAFLIN